MERKIIFLYCSICGEDTEHMVLRASKFTDKTFEGVVKCLKCGNIHQTTIKFPEEIDVKIVYSLFEKSEKKYEKFMENEEIRVGDEFVLDGRRVIVTAIENREGRKVDKEIAKNISTLWVKDFEKVKVKVSINMGRRTLSRELFVEPEEEFCIGDTLSIGKVRCVIHKIKIEKSFVTRGCAPAKKIVRVYARVLE